MAAFITLVAPVLVVLFIAGDVLAWHHTPRAPVDFHIFWTAGHHYLEGDSPYTHSLARAFVYPPPAAALFAPLSLWPYHVAAGLFLVVSLAAILLALWLLGIRDRRLYAAAFLSPALLTSLTIGTITPLLILGLAAVWRLRDRRAAAIPAALLIVLKLFLWPVLVWLLVTRRPRAAAEALVLSLGLTFASWAWIGFADIRRYPSILDQLVGAEGTKSYALGSGRLAEMILGGLVLLALWFGGRLGERRLFALAIVGAILASPIVWLHYFALLAVAAAVLEAPLGYWLIPVLLWATPLQQANGEKWRVGIAAGVCVLCLFARASHRKVAARGLPSVSQPLATP